jgi:hypothetical protein
MSMHRMVFLGAAVAMALNAQHNYYVPEVVDGNTVAHSERARARARVFSVRTTFVAWDSVSPLPPVLQSKVR